MRHDRPAGRAAASEVGEGDEDSDSASDGGEEPEDVLDAGQSVVHGGLLLDYSSCSCSDRGWLGVRSVKSAGMPNARVESIGDVVRPRSAEVRSWWRCILVVELNRDDQRDTVSRLRGQNAVVSCGSSFLADAERTSRR